MKAPYPMVHAPTAAACHRVLDVIYAQGWQLSGMTRPEVNVFVTDEKAAVYPMIGQEGSQFYFCQRVCDRTLVNSPAHLAVYAKTRSPVKPKVV